MSYTISTLYHVLYIIYYILHNECIGIPMFLCSLVGPYVKELHLLRPLQPRSHRHGLAARNLRWKRHRQVDLPGALGGLLLKEVRAP